MSRVLWVLFALIGFEPRTGVSDFPPPSRVHVSVGRPHSESHTVDVSERSCTLAVDRAFRRCMGAFEDIESFPENEKLHQLWNQCINLLYKSQFDCGRLEYGPFLAGHP